MRSHHTMSPNSRLMTLRETCCRDIHVSKQMANAPAACAESSAKNKDLMPSQAEIKTFGQENLLGDPDDGSR
jgi:hypothetical protein